MTDLDPVISRRAALGTVAAAGVVGALAACSSGGGGGAPPVSSPASTPEQSPTSGSGSGSQPLAQLASVPVGQAVSATLDGKPVIVARPSATKAACFSAICTHMGCTVAPAGKQLHCPCHGSVYDAVTGRVISGPAPRPLTKIAVTVKDGEVLPAGGA